MQHKLSIKKIMIAMGIIAAIILISFGIKYWLSFKSIKLVPSDGNTITVIKNDKEAASAQTTKTIKLQTGQYQFKFSQGSDYQEVTIDKTINKYEEITTPQLNYSTAKLATLLAEERVGIQALLAGVPNIGSYQIANEALYIRGEWYGAELIPNTWYDPSVPADYLPRPENPDNTLDIVRIIAHKENNQWVVAAGPSIIFYIKDYPNIPEEVIRAVNKLGF